ncbi:FAD/NAD(P)-binding domain-containing protein, partial [Aureobasidium melanogenum]
AAFKSRARDFAPCLKHVIDDIAEGTPVLEILLADWEPVPWTNSGYVTLAGDAAHPMTMFRGEAANHGILDVHDLWKTLKLVYRNGGNMRDAIRGYGERMMTRATDAILKSRVACEDAHGDSVDENSPLVTERTMPQQYA